MRLRANTHTQNREGKVKWSVQGKTKSPNFHVYIFFYFKLGLVSTLRSVSVHFGVCVCIGCVGNTCWLMAYGRKCWHHNTRQLGNNRLALKLKVTYTRFECSNVVPLQCIRFQEEQQQKNTTPNRRTWFQLEPVWCWSNNQQEFAEPKIDNTNNNKITIQRSCGCGIHIIRDSK